MVGHRFRLTLPADYRSDDFLRFHRRDTQAVAERVGERRLEKALRWRGTPLCICLEMAEGWAEATVVAEEALGADILATIESRAAAMLGLTQPVDEFARRFASHPELGRLIASLPGLRVPLTATPFEALSWAVTGQQISVAAAVSVRRRLIQAAGVQVPGGLRCPPEAAELLALGEAGLRAAGLSQGKAACLLRLSESVLDGALPLDDWLVEPPADLIRERLLSIRGIGPWTVNYALLRGFGWLDGSLHGDVAVRRALQRLLGRSERISAAEAEAWLAEFSPWRALVAAHLWASLALAA